jgi:hypothetical protein
MFIYIQLILSIPSCFFPSSRIWSHLIVSIILVLSCSAEIIIPVTFSIISNLFFSASCLNHSVIIAEAPPACAAVSKPLAASCLFLSLIACMVFKSSKFPALVSNSFIFQTIKLKEVVASPSLCFSIAATLAALSFSHCSVILLNSIDWFFISSITDKSL